jgi:hypothetical protein
MKQLAQDLFGALYFTNFSVDPGMDEALTIMVSFPTTHSVAKTIRTTAHKGGRRITMRTVKARKITVQELYYTKGLFRRDNPKTVSRILIISIKTYFYSV